jgi:ubiquinone/menaquinone biosynthesis C-methylase UbiE
MSQQAPGQQATDLAAVKEVQQKVWSTGDFAFVATLIQPVSEELCEAVDLMPGSRVLDVACGSGNTAIAAARRFGETVGVDYVPELLDRGRERAAAERMEIEFVEGDAENLPFEDESFDYVLSTFGSMFAPDHRRAADELLRVCRSGGKIGLASWTPDGMNGRMFATIGKHAPPPPGLQPPPLWGTREHLEELFGDRVGSLETEERMATFRFRSADHYLEYFRKYFGPTIKAFERVGEEGAAALEADLGELVEGANRAGDRALVADAAYLEAVAVKA